MLLKAYYKYSIYTKKNRNAIEKNALIILLNKLYNEEITSYFLNRYAN